MHGGAAVAQLTSSPVLSSDVFVASQGSSCPSYALVEWQLSCSVLPAVLPSLHHLHAHFTAEALAVARRLSAPAAAPPSQSTEPSEAPPPSPAPPPPACTFPWSRVLSASVLPLLTAGGRALPDPNLPPLPGLPLPVAASASPHSAAARCLLARHCHTHTESASHKMYPFHPKPGCDPPAPSRLLSSTVLPLLPLCQSECGAAAHRVVPSGRGGRGGRRRGLPTRLRSGPGGAVAAVRQRLRPVRRPQYAEGHRQPSTGSHTPPTSPRSHPATLAPLQVRESDSSPALCACALCLCWCVRS